jgi:hypothetical protein
MGEAESVVFIIDDDPQITQITQIKRGFVEDFEAHSSPAAN